MLNNKVVLVTGGTGSFGQKMIETVLERYEPKRLIVLSRDELKQFQMAERFPVERYDAMRYLIGDVRDRDRLYRAFDEVDVVVHAAAMKQVPACEYNPIEAIRTNIMGAANVIDAAIDRGVEKVVALSTDKAANPINLYGATKLASDKLFTSASAYAGAHLTRFSVVRYGNVIDSRGSVIPLFRRARKEGVLPITDPRMTRFWITLQEGVNFVLRVLEMMQGSEIFVPKIPSMNIMNVAAAVGPGCETRMIGIRPGEKLHEVMIPEDDSHNTFEYSDHFRILSGTQDGRSGDGSTVDGGNRCEDDFKYSSDRNDQWLSVDDLRAMLDSGETLRTST